MEASDCAKLKENMIDLPVGSVVGTSGSCAVMSSSPVPSGLAPTSGNSPYIHAYTIMQV